MSNRNLVVTTACQHCQQDQLLEVNQGDYDRYMAGEVMVQTAFPYLAPAERELFISGICPTCWEKMVAAWEIDDDYS